MARRNVGFVDQHIEKAVLGVCAVALLGAVVFTFGGFRFSVNGRSPGGLCEAARTEADTLVQRTRSARPGAKASADEGAVETSTELERWFGASAEGLVRIAGVSQRLPRTQKFRPVPAAISGVDAEDRHNLASIVPPSVPIVTTGRSTFDIPDKADLDDLITVGTGRADTTPSKRSWVSVAAQVDLVAQGVNFDVEKYPDLAYPTVVAVHLQRRDETEAGSDWEDVQVYRPYEPSERPAVTDPSLNAFRRMLDKGHEYIARATLPKRKQGDKVVLPPVPYLDKPPKRPGQGEDEKPSDGRAAANGRARKWRELAKKAMDARPPFKVRDLDAALMLIRAAMESGADSAEIQKAQQVQKDLVAMLSKGQLRVARAVRRPPERLMPLLAHDLDATPGHSYRYRMRYEILNRYAGLPGELKNPADAERLTVFSGWSPPSRRVEISSDVYFFLTKSDERQKEVTVEVFKVTRSGRWQRKEFRVKAGEDIGKNDRRVQRVDFSTGSMCIDIDFSRATDKRTTVAMVYLDKDSGVLRERLLSLDKKDPLRKKLNDLRNGRG